jgi:hypothetical protein
MSVEKKDKDVHRTPHTPTPLAIDIDPHTHDVIVRNLADPKQIVFAVDESKLQTAENIVRAANSHEALLEAAKLGLSYVESEEGSDHSDSESIKKAIKQAEARP